MVGSTHRDWPEWWAWDLDFTSHLLERMIDRCFSEVDLRAMMESARGLRQDELGDRWVIETVRDSRPWEVIVEPDWDDQLLIVITAYPVSTP